MRNWTAELVKKFPDLYLTQKFITVFTRVSHWTLSCGRWIHYKLSQHISLISISLLPPCLFLGLPSDFFFQVFQLKFLTHLPYACYVAHPSHTHRNCNNNKHIVSIMRSSHLKVIQNNCRCQLKVRGSKIQHLTSVCGPHWSINLPVPCCPMQFASDV